MVLVSIDTLRADHVGAYGAADARTPTLDALAAAGARFERAISPAPLTLPSHSSLLTGLDPPGHGVRHNSVFRLAPDVPTVAERMHEAGYATGAFVGAFVLARQYGLGRGFDHYDDAVGQNSGSGAMGFAERRAAQVVDAALAWLETAPGRFFVWVHFYDPHAEYQPPPGFAVSFGMRPYDGEIAYADAQLGRLLAAIDARWPDGRTLVAVTSDHGESLGEHGERTHSHLVYEATQHIPLLLRGPGIAPALVIRDVVALADVAPTLLALAGAPPLAGASGRDLRPLLQGRRLPDRDAYVETLATQLDWDWSPLIGLRTGTFKYIRAPRPELYDLEHDPGETHNLAGQQPERARELDDRLSERLRGTRGVGPTHDPDAEERERLESLGYVVPHGVAPSRALGEVGGPDPKDEIAGVEAVQRADQLLSVGEPERALEELEGVPGNFVVHGLRATAALAAGQPERAELEARATVAASSENPVGWSRLAAALAEQDRLDEARAAWEAALERNPGSGPSWTALGELAEEQGDLETAERCYQTALEATRADTRARWRLAALWIERGEAERAAALEAALEPETHDPEAVLRLVRAERRAGHLDAAAGRLERALEARPTLLPLRLEAALLAEAAGRAEAARREHREGLSVAERTLADAPPAAERPSILYYRARFLLGLGREAEARRDLQAALAAGYRLPRGLRQSSLELAGTDHEDLSRP